MLYAKTKNDEVVEFKTLPFSNETTSFGVNTDTHTIIDNGYFPVVGTEPEYNRTTHKCNGITYTVGKNEVVKSYEIVEIPSDEIAKQELDAKKQEARQYLIDTDWYITRLIETTKAVPEEVLTKRAEARELLNS
jgi:hypothetical protein